MKNQYCYDPQDGARGTVVSESLFDSEGNKTLCNVIWDSGQHSTEKIVNLDISTDVNPRPKRW